MRGLGLADIKQYWGEGGLHFDNVITDHPNEQISDTTVTLLGPTGWTVGVSPMPRNLSTAALLARVKRLVTRACSLGWITNATTCASLSANAVANADQLHALINDLNAQRGNQVNESAYILLLDNVQFVLGRL